MGEAFIRFGSLANALNAARNGYEKRLQIQIKVLLEALKCYKDIEGQKEVQQNFENSKAVTELYFTSLDHL